MCNMWETVMDVVQALQDHVPAVCMSISRCSFRHKQNPCTSGA